MTLTDDQRNSVQQWVESGATLSEVQKRLQQEFSISMTYLDARLLVDDLKLQLAEKPKEPAAPTPQDPLKGPADAPANDTDAADAFEDEVPLPGASSVSVVLDTITRPGFLISGKVTFSDGQKADWSLDQMGRLGLNAETPGYRPSQEDVMAFQVELQRVAM